MQIPSYQIQNVLKAFSRQLSQGRRSVDENEKPDHVQSAHPLKISAEGKKATIIDKVASGIVERIKTFGSPDSMEKELEIPMKQAYREQRSHSMAKRRDKFVFNVIDENNNKSTRMLSVKGSTFIIENLGSAAGQENDKTIH